jgi:ABC-type transport system substrate-binding protein
MSHFTTIAVQVKDGEILQQVLQELGYQVEQNTLVRGYMGNKTKAEYVIRQSNNYDLGFRRKEDEFELIADFWGAKIDQAKFLNPILQSYAHKALMSAVQSQNFNVEQEERLEDGSLRVVVGQWV